MLALSPDQLDQVQLLQMKVQIAIVVEQLRVQLVDQMRGLLHAATLHGLADQDTIVQRVQGNGRLDARFGAKLLGSLLEALCSCVCVCVRTRLQASIWPKTSAHLPVTR